MGTQPEFVYAAFVLPALFSMTLIIEGFAKIQKQEPGWLQLAMGMIFLVIMVSIFAFFMISK